VLPARQRCSFRSSMAVQTGVKELTKGIQRVELPCKREYHFAGCNGCYAERDPSNHASLDFVTFRRILTEKRPTKYTRKVERAARLSSSHSSNGYGSGRMITGTGSLRSRRATGSARALFGTTSRFSKRRSVKPAPDLSTKRQAAPGSLLSGGN